MAILSDQWTYSGSTFTFITHIRLPSLALASEAVVAEVELVS